MIFTASVLRSRRVAGSVLGALALSTVLQPSQAEALDLTFYVAATVNFAQVGPYRQGGDDEKADQARTRGTIFLALGLACDALALVLVAATADRVERLDTEVAHGGGPITDAYAEAFGLPREAVLDAMRAVSSQPAPLGTDVQGALVARLLPQARITDDNAAPILYGFHEERSRSPGAPRPWHDALARLSGVPAADLDPLIDATLDARLAVAARPGVILSARTALAQDAATTFDALIQEVYARHPAVVDAQIAAALEPGPGAG